MTQSYNGQPDKRGIIQRAGCLKKIRGYKSYGTL
jgi:hypothetical protein